MVNEIKINPIYPVSTKSVASQFQFLSSILVLCFCLQNLNGITSNTGVTNSTFPCIVHFDSFNHDTLHPTKDVHSNIIKFLSGFIGGSLSKNSLSSNKLLIYRVKSKLRLLIYIYLYIYKYRSYVYIYTHIIYFSTLLFIVFLLCYTNLRFAKEAKQSYCAVTIE